MKRYFLFFSKYHHTLWDHFSSPLMQIGRKEESEMIAKVFLDHPASVDETYGEHAVFAGKFAVKLFAAAFAATIHAIIPCLFEKTASRIIADLYAKTHNRGQ